MDTISRDQLETLAQQRHRACVSMFLPTHRAGTETRQDPIRLKNLLRETEALFLAENHRRMKAKEMLAPARQLAQRSSFWRMQDQGLAIYLAENFFQYFRLPLELPERVVLAEQFDLKPLLPLFTAGGRYYLLAISQNQVRLFEGTRFGINEMDLRDVPRSLEEALKYDVRESQLQAHTGTGVPVPGGRSKEGAVFHGQGVGVDDEKDRILQYFRQVNHGLRYILKDPSAPLLLAGVEELFPIYNEANTHQRLLEQGVKGSPDGMGADELHKAAWKVVQPYFAEARGRAISQYRSVAGTPRASNKLDEVLLAAYQGRVEFAFIPPDVERRGRFDPDQAAVEVHEAPQSGDEDLVNAAAIYTVLNHGAIYTIASEDIPDASPVAALYRYPV